VLISKGTIAPTAITTAVVDASDSNVVITFPVGNSGANQAATDKAILAVFNATLNVWEGYVTTAARSTGTVTQSLVNTPSAGNACHVYLAFISATGNQSSDSVYQSATAQA